ncbi:MAG TPA: Rieske 2Fe-2S domain-containing protein [Streptosporangiaceae bacterium]|nr:Rieske 2Fe-2S domain-containing protein [Streptosporangiaceae bacterium]
MSNTNSPGSDPEFTGSSSGSAAQGESGDTAWQEYLTGGEHGAGVSGTGVSGADVSGGSVSGASASGDVEPEIPGTPRRVIGTPPPAVARTMLPASGHDGPQPPARELPAGPEDPVHAKRAERVVAACFLLSMLAGFGFLVAYSLIGVGTIEKVHHSNLALGLCLSLMMLLLAVGATIWVRHLMPNVELTEQRHPLASDRQDREAFKETFTEGAEASQFVKRPLVRRSLIAATVPLAIAPLFLLRDLGPLPGTSLDYTVWRKGLRLLIYGTNRPITPAEFSSPGSIISVVPEGYQDDFDALAKAAVVIIKFRPGQLQFTSENHAVPNKVVQNWTVDNIVAYSKICTHVGCPAALYEQTTHYILCPCHQSTFLATEGARVIFGPATRPLPQLPMGVDAQGYLIATGDFQEPVGPSFWERS